MFSGFIPQVSGSQVDSAITPLPCYQLGEDFVLEKTPHLVQHKSGVGGAKTSTLKRQSCTVMS